MTSQTSTCRPVCAFPIGQAGLLLAGEALDDQDPDSENTMDVSEGISRDRPPIDWEYTATLLLARVQLDQMIGLLRDITRVADPLVQPERACEQLRSVANRLWADDQDRSERTGETILDDIHELIFSVEEALELRRALASDILVGHSFAVDGSITFTGGPAFPACPTLGLKDSNGELDDSPRAIFAAARHATECAAVLAFRVRENRSA